MRVDRNLGAVLGPLSVLAGGALFVYLVLAAKLGIPFAIPVGIIGAGAAAIVLTGPLGKAIVRQLESGGSGLPDETAGQLLGELDELRQRVAELEERADFSERLLAQHQERSRLAEQSDR